MNQTPTVTIIIPCYNSAWSLPKLADCIKPLLTPDLEVVFIDDGSTDGSYELFHSLVPGAVAIRQENKGLGATRNQAAELARGEFLQLLDADDTIEPGKIETQVRFAFENEVDVVYSDWRMMIVDEKRECPEPTRRAETKGEIVEALLDGWWFPPNAALIRKEAYVAVGGCDPTLHNTGEDFDLWMRLGIAGFKYGYVAGYFANYYRYLQQRSMSRMNRRDYFSGEETMVLKSLKLMEKKGTLTLARRRAAARRLHSVARNVYDIDPAWFKHLLERVYELDPEFGPPGSLLYRASAKVLGLERAERIAVWKRSLPAYSKTS